MVLENDLSHLMSQLQGQRETSKGSSLSSTHIPAIRFHYIFPPFKRGKEGAYYTIFRKKAIATVHFRIISAEKTSYGTNINLKSLAVKLLQCKQNCIHLSLSVSFSLYLSLSLICLSLWLAVTLSLCFSVRPVDEWVKQAVPDLIPTGSWRRKSFQL